MLYDISLYANNVILQPLHGKQQDPTMPSMETVLGYQSQREIISYWPQSGQIRSQILKSSELSRYE